MSETKIASCMCESIKYEMKGTPFSFSLCHCQMCQKFSGSAFGAFMGVKKADLKCIQGEELEQTFESSEWASRVFCKKCGSSLKYLFHQNEDSIFLSAGLFDSDLKETPKRHIFVKDRCAWLELPDDGIEKIEKY